MKYEEALKLLKECGQEHVLAHWEKLGRADRAALLAQIERFDAESLERCREALAKGSTPPDASKGLSAKVDTLKGEALAKAEAAGWKELRAGRVAVLLVAGGQGSRLGFDGPKGAYPIGPVTGAPLFYFHARKVLARSARCGRDVPFYIMTSEANNAATVECFRKNKWFGLKPENVVFFTQGMWPGMTPDGKVILDAPGRVFTSPDGHGGLLAAMKRNGVLADMKKRGVKSVFYFQVDNPLVDVASPSFIGYHVLNRSQYSLKLYAKSDPMEKLGMPMRFGDRYRMIEYSEMTEEQSRRTKKDGTLYHLYGSPAIHVFDRAFLEKEASKPMPLHLAFKRIPYIDAAGRTVKPASPNGYKFEKFIFDMLPDAERVGLLAFEKDEEYGPVKNAEGDCSPATCRAAMEAKWRRMLAAAGVSVPEGTPVEIDPAGALGE